MTVTHPAGLERPTLDDSAIADAAARFVAGRRSAVGFDAFPGPAPEDLATAYAIQLTAASVWADPIAGWKIALVPPAKQEQLGSGRFLGPIFTGMVAKAGEGALSFPVIPSGFGAVEAEFVVRIAADAPADKLDYSPAEASAFIASIHAGIEIVGSPLSTITTLGPTVAAAAFGNNIGLVVGAEIPGGLEALDTLRSEVVIDNQSVGVGSTASIPGGIATAVAFALGMAARLGHPLRAGQWLSTGALSGMHPINAGQQARISFTGLEPMTGTAVAATPVV
ncbi:2-keto-4-pentenoate hydratase [Azospirillum doebereinerae]|uniref:2-keto-4-pentenoate hydratase n=1 Tax=Azospirillum doebereinerae TaxID=92933 RepID=A0A433J787_9PROT|nr:2-keto-4-pentenoate hydratase [Azospirillum doebereinerae]MCG5240679.1 2-keto-4-pentenoate hydratase [Azospirillum doebereinerae]RUQ69293.1 2-keto-4-pentenoate hydratase [Azospirillum doebereinerae]